MRAYNFLTGKKDVDPDNARLQRENADLKETILMMRIAADNTAADHLAALAAVTSAKHTRKGTKR